MVARIFIDGEAGTTGLGIRERLSGMAGFDLVSIASESRKDPRAKRALLSEIDLAILCLPDEAAKETAALVKSMGEAAPRLLDASTAHRVAAGWTYGFPELVSGQKDKIANSRFVANPGCYATGAIALLRPLVDAGLIPAGFPVSIHAVSGYSGGGRSMIEAYESGAAPNFELYALGLEHKHLPEIEAYSRLSRPPLFVPLVGNFRQGMLVSIPLHLDDLPGRPAADDLAAALTRHYAEDEEHHVRVRGQPEAGRIEPEALNDTDDMELFVCAGLRRRQAVLVARLDNLGKGASGAAVQNILLMLKL